MAHRGGRFMFVSSLTNGEKGNFLLLLNNI